MKLSDFKYNLPKTSIAKYPVSPRDKSKLLVIHKETGEMEDKKFTDVINYMEKGDVLVVNETRVFQARLFGKKEKTQAKIEVFLLRELNKDDCILIPPIIQKRLGLSLGTVLVAETETDEGMLLRILSLDKLQRQPFKFFNKPVVKQDRGQRMASILRQLALSNTFAEITDPLAWQREMREDRALPGREA